MIRSISVPSGIGDSIWLLSKLINTGEKFSFNIPNGIPQRSKQVFDLLPDLVHSSQYVPGLSYRKLASENIQNNFKTWKHITAPKFCLSMNHHLESGNRIEEFFPDLATSYVLPWKTQAFAAEVAIAFPPDRKYVGIYGSSYSTSGPNGFGFWQVAEWVQLVESIHKVRPDITFVQIGAAFDLDLSSDIATVLTKKKIPFKTVVGYGMGYVAELMKILSFAFYFPFGLPIFSESLGNASDCIMFYPQGISGIMGGWASKKRIEAGNITEQLFNTPDFVFDWFRDEYKFETRL